MLIRFARRPSKQLNNLLLRTSPELRQTFPVGLDVGAGNYDNSYLCRTSSYVAVDIQRSNSPLPHFPAGSDFVLLDFTQQSLPKADLVLCQQTIGFSPRFQVVQTLNAVNNLIQATRKDGTLTLNTGPLLTREMNQAVDDILRANYSYVRRIRYGNWDRISSPLIGLLGGMLMLLIGSLRHSRKNPEQYLYFATMRV